MSTTISEFRTLRSGVGRIIITPRPLSHKKTGARGASEWISSSQIHSLALRACNLFASIRRVFPVRRCHAHRLTGNHGLDNET